MSNKRGKKDAPDYPLARVIRESAHQIWLAGLGAMGRAETEGARWFESLISLGEQIEQSARLQIQRPIDAVEKTVTDVRETANDTWTRIEIAFERRVAHVLNSMQIPTSRDIDALTRRVEALQGLVAELSAESRDSGSRAAAKAPSRRKKAAGKKKAVRRKTSSRTGRTTTGRKPARRPKTGQTRASG
ncbi:MAG: phasin family protein [Gammaproteobacteria bacterium]|jgi:poly(hydroxyalkanoate) granule-associated protein